MAKSFVGPSIYRNLTEHGADYSRISLSRLNIMWLIILVITIRPLIDLSGDANKGLNAGGLLAIIFCPVYLILYAIGDRMRYRTGHVLTVIFAVLAIIAALIDYLSPVDASGTGTALFQQAIREFCGMALIGLPFAYFGISVRQNMQMQKVFFIILLSACIVPICIAYLQFVGQYPFTYFDVLDGQYVGRPSGGYTQPNSLARLLIFLIFCAYFRIVFLKGNRNVTLYLLVAFMMITLFITTHRISLLCGIMVCVGMELLIGFGAIEAIVGLFLFVPIIIVSTLPYLETLAQSNMVRSLFAFTSDGQISTRGRATLWAGANQFFFSLPGANWLIGIGREPFTVDSDFWRILLVHGVIGGSLFIVGLIVSFIAMMQITQGKKRGAVIILYLYLFIYMVTLEPTSYTLFMWIFFALLYFVRCAPDKT